MDNELEKQKNTHDFILALVDKVRNSLVTLFTINKAFTLLENLNINVGDIFSNNNIILDASTQFDLICSILTNFKERVTYKPFCGQ